MIDNDPRPGSASTACRRGGRPLGRWRAPVTALVFSLAVTGLTAAGTLAGTTSTAEASGLPVVATGGYHTCALMPDQSVWCWGQNLVGQLGNGTTTDSLIPVHVGGLPAAVNIATGEYHTCAVDTTNRVWCWGSNAYGELGNGTTSQDSPVPGQVTGGLLAAQVAAGHEFSCAVTLTHTVDCWGDNNYGELGNGTKTDSSTPVAVKGLANVTEVATGDYHACAVESNRTLWCWGYNGHGELGNGTTKSSSVPVIVGMQNVTQVSAGSSYTCAIGNAPGDLWCWGWNDVGQDGDGTTVDRHVPTQVAGLSSGVQQVSAGMDSTCVIAGIPGAAALCWGDNNHGKIGDGIYRTFTPFPSQVFGLQTPAAGGPGGMPYQVAAGGQHACAVLTSSVLRCWGYGYYGQLGTGTSLDSSIPTTVIGLPGPAGAANAVTAGTHTSCAVTGALNADCWGQAVGDGSPETTVHTSATPVTGLPAGGVSQVSAGFGGCALVRPGGLATAVRCWGWNNDGQLGNGTTTDSLSPVKVKGLSSHVESVSNGYTENCALVHDGGAWCWGDNSDGELGNGTTTSSTTPVQVTGLPSSLAQVGAGIEHACALLFDGTVQCWGQNNEGQLGNGTTSNSTTPVAVSGLSGAVQVAVADEATCALTSAGGVECWGDNALGELGDGSTVSSNVPVAVSGLSGAVSIAASDGTVCAALITGQVDCWGDNTYGELGSGSVGTPAFSDTPVTVSGGFISSGWVGVSSSAGSTICALSLAQQANCWGDNSVGELGDGASGTTTDSGTPVAVQGL